MIINLETRIGLETSPLSFKHHFSIGDSNIYFETFKLKDRILVENIYAFKQILMW